MDNAKDNDKLPNISLNLPKTIKPIDRFTLARFAAGFIFFNMTFMTAGGIASSVLLPARFNTLGIGKGETILGTMNSVSIIFALIANVIFGALSDASHSRFGKRTPWILAGAPIAALGYYMTSVSTTLVGIVAWWSLLQIGLNCMLAPCVAILSDRIPQKSRGTLSAFYGVGQIIGASLGTIIGSAFVDTPKVGFTIGTVCWLFLGIITVVLIPKEPSAVANATDKFSFRQVLMQFRPPTHSASDFYKALVGRLMLILRYNMIVGFQLYVCMRYIGQDQKTAAATVSTMSVIIMVISLVISLCSGPVSDRLGKRKLPVFVSSVIIAIGIAVPWLWPTKIAMFVYAGLMGLGYGMYMAVDQALNIDVLPNPDEAGKDLGILNLANTLGQVIAPAVVSPIVTLTGSYFQVFPIAIAAVIIGAVVIMTIKKVS
jgi:MFS family permease